MFFDAASLFTRFRDINLSVFFKGASEVPEEKLEPIRSAYDILEAFLASGPFLVGKHLTIADISVAVTAISTDYYVPIKADKHPNIVAWLKRVRESIPVFDEVNAVCVKGLNELISGSLEKNKQK